MAAKRKPNIVFLGIDSLRADHMSLYGYPRMTTPFIDRFAKGGTVFENTYSAYIPTTSGYTAMRLRGQRRLPRLRQVPALRGLGFVE